MSDKSFTEHLFDQNDHTPVIVVSDDDIKNLENFVEVMQILFGESEASDD